MITESKVISDQECEIGPKSNAAAPEEKAAADAAEGESSGEKRQRLIIRKKMSPDRQRKE